MVLIIITIIGNIYYYYIVLINLALYSYLFKKITKIYELHKKILVTEKILKLQSKAWRSNDHFLKFKFCLKFFSLLYFIEKDYCYYLHFDISAKVCIKIIRFMYIEGRSSDLMVNILVACVTAMHPPWKKKVGESVTWMFTGKETSLLQNNFVYYTKCWLSLLTWLKLYFKIVNLNATHTKSCAWNMICSSGQGSCNTG